MSFIFMLIKRVHFTLMQHEVSILNAGHLITKTVKHNEKDQIN